MKTALNAGDPVLMLETKALFASKGPVPVGEHYVPFGLARIARVGEQLTIATAGQLVHRALEAAGILEREGISVEIIDLRTIQPLDVETVAASVRKTNRLLVVDEGYAMFGVGAEVAQSITELCFDYLDGPVARLHTAPMSHPFAPALERAMLVNTDMIVERARRTIAGYADPIMRFGSGLGLAPAAADAGMPTLQSIPLASNPTTTAAVPPMAQVDGEAILMPFGDLTVSEGRLIKWHLKVGDKVQADDLICEVETDKAVVEISSPKAGVLTQMLQDVGNVVKMGEIIGVVSPT
jgi:2-oxoisovalerate dehydrogenase E1 component